MKPFFQILCALCVLCSSIFSSAHAADKESAFERVTNTGTLRCAYATLSPFIIVDPATKKITGALHDITEEMAKRLNLKVEWTEEVAYSQISAGIKANKYDAFCGTLWATPARAAGSAFSAPIYFNTVNACVRGDSTEYDKSSDPLNSPDKTLIGYDGDISSQLARTLFPKAKILSIPENVSFAEAISWIATKKADALATCDRVIVDDFNAQNEKKLKIASPGKPLTHIQVVYGLPLNDSALKNMVDTAIFDMQADGTIARLMTPYLKERMKDTVIIPTIGKK